MSNLLLYKAGAEPAFFFKNKKYEYKKDNTVSVSDIQYLSDMNGASRVNVVSIIETMGVVREFSVYAHKGEESMEKLVSGNSVSFISKLTLDRDYLEILFKQGVSEGRKYKQTIFIYSPRINIIEKINYLKR